MPLSTILRLWEFLNGGKAKKRQSVLIAMKDLRPSSFRSLRLSPSGNKQIQQRLVRPCLVSFQGFGYHYGLMNKKYPVVFDFFFWL